MARPEEKAQAMLNKWVRMREEEDPNSSISRRSHRNRRRPFLASQCENLHDAEHFRNQIVREISDGIRKIQNPGMGEHAIRDLNDEINKLLREKWHWNRRIKELGGPDYIKEERKAMMLAESEGGDMEQQQAALGLGLKGSGGYRYFGAAKDLPGVKELFARHAAKMTKKKRGDIYKYITPDYYGLRDEEDGVLLELEHQMTRDNQRQFKRIREEYRNDHHLNTNSNAGSDEDSVDEEAFLDGVENGIAAHVAVPSQETVAQVLLDKKRKDLLHRLL